MEDNARLRGSDLISGSETRRNMSCHKMTGPDVGRYAYGRSEPGVLDSQPKRFWVRPSKATGCFFKHGSELTEERLLWFLWWTSDEVLQTEAIP